jgi:predicted nuclease of predicted toxin-antitoxin system
MKKILLDENLPKPLAKQFAGNLEVISVHDMGWAELKNGELIKAMLENDFEYLLTADKNLQNQQNLDRYPVKIILIRTYDNRYKTLIQYLPLIQQLIEAADESQKIIEIDIRNLKL